MGRCDALIVGAGPAGSACAWRLRRAGLDVVLLDREQFPRDKVCGGWITPEVLEELQIAPEEYARGRVCQSIRGFRVGPIGKPGHEIVYPQVVSYGIRRCEFDAYLASRSGARLLTGVALSSLERSNGQWIVNGEIRAPLVIGAGGHFCPVARFLGARSASEVAVAAQEVEFAMDAAQSAQIPVRAEVPELYFCNDLHGYGWIFRKQHFLNVGFGRLGERQLVRHMAAFLDSLRRTGRLPFALPTRPSGHAYLLYGDAHRTWVAEGVVLIGDAAGLAHSPSGEGIRPAVESGLLAAEAILEAGGHFTSDRLSGYRERLIARFGKAHRGGMSGFDGSRSLAVIRAIAGPLLGSRWFARHMILDRWFLHRHQTALAV